MERGIIDAIAVRAVNKALVCLDIIVYLDIGSVPYVIVAGKLLTDRLDAIPVVVAVEFIAVSPYVKQSGNELNSKNYWDDLTKNFQ